LATEELRVFFLAKLLCVVIGGFRFQVQIASFYRVYPSSPFLSRAESLATLGSLQVPVMA
jgi:hypothetical protein